MAFVLFLNQNVKWPVYKINTYPKILTRPIQMREVNNEQESRL